MARKKSKELAPDAFQQEGQSWVKWLEAHLKLVLGAIIAVLAAVVGLEYAESHNRHGEALVTASLEEVVDDYREATDLRKVLTSTSAETLKKDYEAAAGKLERFVEDHPKTEAARIASLYHADLLARMDRHEEAEAEFAAYVESARPNDELLFFALEGLGYAQEAQDKNDEALATFEKLGTAQPFYEPYALKHQARVLQEKGDKEKAKAKYERLVEVLDARLKDKYPNGAPPNAPESSLKHFAETRIKAL